MLDKNNSGLWDYYRSLKNKGILENETLKQYMLGLSICVTIDKFIEKHPSFGGKNELFAIRGMLNNQNEEFKPYAASYNNDIESAMRIVRPKLKDVLTKNNADPTALILYVMTGMFLPISDEEANEQNHILLSLLEYESSGVDVSECKELWSFFVDTLGFEATYDSSQIEGKTVRPVSFNPKHESKGFLTESAQSVVAEFVFMNISKLDPEWMSMFAESPKLAAGIISLKSGITEDLWTLYGTRENEAVDYEPFRQFRGLARYDIDRALDDLIDYTKTQITAYGSSFIRCLTTADLLCMKLCDRDLDKESQKTLDDCIENLENTNSFPAGASLEDVLASFHREMHLPELYFMFFTIFYSVDYGSFRSLAQNFFKKYGGNTSKNKSPSTPNESSPTSKTQPQNNQVMSPAPQKTESPSRTSTQPTAATSVALPSPNAPKQQNRSEESQIPSSYRQQNETATTRTAAATVQPASNQRIAKSDGGTHNHVSALIQMNKTTKKLDIAHLIVDALLFLGMIFWSAGDFIIFALTEAGLRVVRCFFDTQKYSSVWETRNFQTSIAITSYGLVGFLICLFGCLFKEHLGFALILLTIREVLVFMLIRKSLMRR